MEQNRSPFDIFFLSYDEPNADQNWNSLRQRFPQAKRIHGVDGILSAHKACAKLSETPFFFVVDGDNEIHTSFVFHLDFIPEKGACYVWRALNPVNGLIYGFGAVKLLDRDLILAKKVMGVDMTTSLGDHYVIRPELASTTRFNSSPYQAWKSAFRECVKLASGGIARRKENESSLRLETWISVADPKAAFSEWSLRGARCGKEFATAKIHNAEELAKINDYRWLMAHFRELYGLGAQLSERP